jgi:hypothetical protein
MKRLLIAVMILSILVFVIPTGSVQAEADGYFHTHTCYVYLGRWVWDSSKMGFWRPPVSMTTTFGTIDLRGMDESGVQGSTNGELGGYGVFFLETTTSQQGAYLLGEITNGNLSIDLPPAAKNFLQNKYDITLSSYSINGTIFELYVDKGDPSGKTRWAPLIPEMDGMLRIVINGFSPVVFGRDAPRNTPAWNWSFGWYKYYDYFYHRWFSRYGWHRR